MAYSRSVRAYSPLEGYVSFEHVGVHVNLEQREFFIENLLIRIHFIIEMIRWTGLAPWEFEFPFPGSLTSTFLIMLSR